MNLITKHLILAFFSFLMLLSTVFIDKPINNTDQMGDVRFGYPLAFISQNFIGKEMVFSLPWYIRFRPSIPIQEFYIWQFVCSFIAVFVVIEIVIVILEWLVYKFRTLLVKRKSREQ